jgi:hypothetical protein
MMKTVLYSILGFLGATVVVWGGLFAWGAIALPANDSYWDRSPYSADAFFACWIILAVCAAIAAAKLGSRGRKTR